MLHTSPSTFDNAEHKSSDTQEQIDFLKNEVLLKFRINKNYDKAISSIGSTVDKDEIEKEVDRMYETGLEYLEDNVALCQESRDKIGKDFFEYVAKKTWYPWKYAEYNANVITNKHWVSNWDREGWETKTRLDVWIAPLKTNGNAGVFKITFSDEQQMRRTVAHELILAQYFWIYREHYKDAWLSDWQVWALSEIAAYALTWLTEKVRDWRPNIGYINKHTYPQIYELQNELKDVFENSSFDEYIKKGIELVKKYPDMGPNWTKNPPEKRNIWEVWKRKFWKKN